jgi:transcriptional regulator of acetoin/glycerol metabolism
LGLRAHHPATFQHIPAQQIQRTLEANHNLIEAAKPVLQYLGRAIVNTRYFVILTNAEGVVVDAGGAIDHADPRAHLITRVGTDLSEASMGTTAIGTTLTMLQSVWLHRGEHFFDSTSAYSCAGAPLFGPDGTCVGMLDVTGVDVVERPELKHLVAQSASKIENALLLLLPHALTLRLNWPGTTLGSDADGLVCVDADGFVTGANTVARQLVSGLAAPSITAVHVSEVFGVPTSMLFDAARPGRTAFELPLWTGLRLQALALLRSRVDMADSQHSPLVASVPLRDVHVSLIRQAVTDAHGNVMQAARRLGISRATVYRALSKKD